VSRRRLALREKFCRLCHAVSENREYPVLETAGDGNKIFLEGLPTSPRLEAGRTRKSRWWQLFSVNGSIG
jgi:hypothetical protein